ncbi:MAG TPA: VTT domain-containing protein [Solirubrobacteraceae bacterium]|nr:VTT domain-containing protein [Solirubrobacteraceae bacterium]
MILASLINVDHLVEVAGYPLLFVLVMGESGGVPIPGETALITASVLSSQGKLQIEWVIALAAIAAIVGDNLGYLIGRKGGRWLLERPGRLHRQRLEVLRVGEPFFERHGPKAVFFGRFVLGLRVWASWLAGATRMPWRSFLLWNALGGICWATGIGLLAYFLGNSASNAIEAFGIWGLIAAVLAVIGGFVLHRRAQRREREVLESQAREDHERADSEERVSASVHAPPPSPNGNR